MQKCVMEKPNILMILLFPTSDGDDVKFILRVAIDV